VVGLSAAYQLSKRNYKTVIIEKAEWLASEASSDNTGGTLPFNQMLNEPLMYGFVRDSIEAHKRLINAGLKYDFRMVGCIYLLYEEQQRKKLEETLESLPSTEKYRVLTKEEILEMEPALTTEIIGGVLFPDCTLGTSNKLCGELSREVRKAGTAVMTSSEVKSFKKDSGKISSAVTNSGEVKADNFVIATGPWSNGFSDDLGFGIPTIPIKGHTITWRTGTQMISNFIWTRNGVVVPGLGQVVTMGGGMDYTGFDKSKSERTVRILSSSAVTTIPKLATLESSVWVALRPGTPDTLPIIGRSSAYKNLIVATGHYHEGFTGGPLTGEIVEQLISEGACDLPYLEIYRPGRFNC